MSSPLWDGVREGCGSCEFGLRQVLPTWPGKVPQPELEAISCRRFPPVLMYIERQHQGGMPYKDVGQWVPTMAQSDWCGEYKRRGA